MPERIGLEAVLSLSSFSSGVNTYLKSVATMSAQTTSAASSINSQFVSLGSGVLKFGAIAGGVALAGVTALAGGLVLLGSTALTEFAKYERMSLSVQSLVARDIAQGKVVEQQRTVAIGLTKKEAAELDGLAAKIEKEEASRNTLGARIREQSEALRQLREAHGADALDVGTATARLDEMTKAYNRSGTEIDNLKNRMTELSGKEGQLTTVMEKVRTGQISMTEAMAQAGPKAKELLHWISQLAIESPFTEEGINNAFQTALAYGFTVDKAKELTQAEVDYAAATGKGVEATNLIALALGQMQAKGKVSGQEIIQLTNAGVGVNRILEDMGFTLDDVSAGLVDSDQFIQAVIDDMNIFKGAAKDQANTFSGLISTLSDLKAIGLREFFAGTFTTIQPYLADFVGMLTSAALETGSIRALGDALGTVVADGLTKVVAIGQQFSGLFSAFQTGGAAGLIGALGITPDAISLLEKFQGMITQIAEVVAGPFITAFSDLSAEGILDTINQSVTFLNDHFTELQAALLGIGAVLATGVFAALVAGVLSLLTPVNLLIVGVATLFAAWEGNWYGIRDTATEIWAVIQPILSDLYTWLQTTIPQAVQVASDVWNDTLLPALEEVKAFLDPWIADFSKAFEGLKTNISEMLPQLASDILTGIPEQLTKITDGITDFFANNVPDWTKTLSEWSDTFWGWVDTVTEGAGTALAGILLAITDWAASPDAQESLNNMGKELGKAIVAGIGFLFDQQDQWGTVLLKAVGGLLAAVAVITVDLVAVGGEIVAGIVSGILEAMGVDLQPATITELREVLTGIANNGATIAIYIGEKVVEGIKKGFRNAWSSAKTTLTAILTGGLSSIVDPIPELLSEPFSKASKAIEDAIGDLSETVLPLFTEGIDRVVEAIKNFISSIKEAASAAADFVVPDILMPGSPPPLAYAMMDIATGADTATTAIQGLASAAGSSSFTNIGAQIVQRIASGVGLAGGSIQEAIKKSLGFAAGNFTDIALFGKELEGNDFFAEEERDALEKAMKRTFDRMYDGIAKGTAGAKEFYDAWIHSVQGLGKGFTSEEWSEIVDIGKKSAGKIVKAIQQQFGALTIEMKQQALQMAGSLNSIGGSFAGMLQAQMGDPEEAKKLADEIVKTMALPEKIKEDFQKQAAKIEEEYIKQDEKLQDSNEKLSEKNKELEESSQELTQGLALQQNQLATLQAELLAMTSAEGANALAIEKKNLAIEQGNEALEFGARQLEIYQRELAGMQEGTIEFDQKKLAIDRLTESMDAQGQKLVTLKEELTKLTANQQADTLAIEKKKLEIEKLSVLIDKNKQTVTANSQAIQQNSQAILENNKAMQAAANLQAQQMQQAKQAEQQALAQAAEQLAQQMHDLQQTRAGTIEALKMWIAANKNTGAKFKFEYKPYLVGVESQMLSIIGAQNIYNSLLEEQRKEEELITKQKEAQQKLDFLKSQLDLIALGKQLGGNIFQGMKFGLDASLTDLLAATNAIVEAMVNQINTDLEMGSPSKLMIRTFKNVMAGAAIGVERGGDLLSNAIKAIPLLNGAVQPTFTQPAGYSRSYSNSTTYNMPMTVVTTASPQGVIQQYEVRRSLLAA